MRLIMRYVAGLVLGLSVAASCLAAELLVDVGGGERRYTTRELLEHKTTQRIDIADDVAYEKPMSFQAIPMAELLEGVPEDAYIQAVALDGFAADIPARILLNTDDSAAKAWLAIEDPAQPWPKLSETKGSAGPFYLVWTNPDASGIVPEQWPYQVGTFRRVGSVEERFPGLVPDDNIEENSPVRLGWATFRVHCMVCHRVNGQGDARMGPDLIKPFGVTEYIQPKFLRIYIRNPQSLRDWPAAKMPAFTPDVLSDEELEGVLAYLDYMVQRR